MEAHRFGLPLAVAATVATAGAATLLLLPRGELPSPAPVAATDYFSPEELERAHEFRGPGRLLALGGLAASGGALALLAFRPPRSVRRLLERAEARPMVGGAAAGAALSLTVGAVGLPFAAVGHARARDVGLSTQTWGPWLVDVGKAAGIEAVFAAGGAALLLGIVRRFPRRWWAVAGVAATSAAVAFSFASPVVIEPLFNRFTPLPAGSLRSDVLELAHRSGVEVGEVYRVDASRRTTGANAYVGGLGTTKRVVLYDTLIDGFSPDQVRSVVAHELAHVKHRDLLRGLTWIAIVAPAGLFLVQQLTERFTRPAGAAEERSAGARVPSGTPAMLPVLALSLALVSLAIGVGGNVLSRRVEASADAFALDLTHDPAAFIGLERRLSLQNVAEPDPPAVLHALFATHPKPLERIGAALRWRDTR